MTELFRLLGTVAVETGDAKKALNDVSQEGQKTESKLSRAFSAMGRGAAAAGKAIAAGLAAGATAMAGLTMKALQASGDLEQNMGGAEAVFGELGKTIGDMKTPMQQYDSATGKVITVTKDLETVSKEAYKNMGLSQSDYLATANKMGALFKGAGFETQEALDLSSQAMQRAADVASIMGIDTEAAMEAVAGAAKGNFTMMDNLGVAMNDTAIAAYAAEKGINKTTAEMSQQEKIGLAMEMFLDKTSYAAGNYAKENETLAGSLGTAKSALTNFLSGSGDVESVVSSFSGLANVVVNSLGEIVPRLTTGLVDIVNQLAPQIPVLLNTLLPVLIQGAVGLVQGLVAALPDILSAILAALPMLIEGFVSVVNSLIEALPSMMQAICDALPTLIPALINGIVSMIVTLCENFSAIIQPLIDALPDIIISLVEAIVQNLPALIQGIISLIMGIVEAIPQIIQALVDALPTVVSLLVQAILNNLPAIIMGLIQVVMGIVKALPQILGSLIQSVPAALSGIWDGIGKVFSGLGSKIGTWLKNALNTVKDWIKNLGSKAKEGGSNFLNNIIDFFKQLPGKVWEWLKNVVSKIGEWISNIGNKAKEAGSGFVTKVVDFFKQLPGKVWEWLKNVVSKIGEWASNIFTKVKEVGKNLIEGIWKGISGAYDWIKKKIKEWVGNVTKFIKNLFGIKSPSTVMRDEVGRYLAEGVAVGIQENTAVATAAMKELGDSVTAQAKKNLAKEKDITKKINSEIVKVAKDKLKAYKQNNELTAEAEAEYWDTVRQQVAEGTKERIEADQMYFDARKSIDDELLNAAQERLDTYKVYNEMTLAEEAGFWDEIRVQFEEGSDARIEADKSYLEAKKSINEKIVSAEEKLQSRLEEISNMAVERQKELLDTFDLFANFNPEESGLDPSSEMLLDIQAQINSLEKYDSIMKSLEGKMGGTALFDHLKGLGMGSINELIYVDKMTAEELKQYVALFDKRSELAGNIAKEEVKDDVIAETQKAYEDFAKSCSEIGVDVSGSIETMKINGTNSMAEFTSSIVNGLSALKEALADFKNNLELPNLSVSTDLDTSGAPSLNVEWYASAMRSPKLMNKPTIFGYNATTGNYMGGGEAGSEVVSGTSTLMTMIQTAVAEQNQAMTQQLKKIVEMLAAFFPQLLEACNIDLFIDGRRLATELAPDMDDALGIISSRKERGR